jgi:NAD(P)-dependent dehydrogenase (short-subunit alcohol dehydrogenase family)
MSDRSVALVTGGNTGIGLALCRALATAGLQVLLGARDTGKGAAAVQLLRDEGHDVTLCPIDITDDESVRAAQEAIEREHGRLDVLINNAALKTEFAPALPSTTPLAVVRDTLDTNVIGTIRVIQAMLPLLRRSPAGRIVNMTSTLGSLGRATDLARGEHRVPLLGYATSKTAINAVTVQFANELRNTAIKVNAADPGSVATPMNPNARRTPDEATAPIVTLALLPSDGPTGACFDADGPVPW